MIKARIKEDRWEVTEVLGLNLIKICQMGESHGRHILYTKNYLNQLLNIDSSTLNIAFGPDYTFGHNTNMPEILQNAGIDYYYFCRGYDGHHYSIGKHLLRNKFLLIENLFGITYDSKVIWV